MKYAFIDRHRRSYQIRALCDALQVSRSGYYAARGRVPSARQQRRATLTVEIRKIHTASRETYGAPRVHAELSAQNVPCCRNTVAKLMRHEQKPRDNPGGDAYAGDEQDAPGRLVLRQTASPAQ